MSSAGEMLFDIYSLLMNVENKKCMRQNLLEGLFRMRQTIDAKWGITTLVVVYIRTLRGLDFV